MDRIPIIGQLSTDSFRIEDLDIEKREGKKSNPTPHQKFYGVTSAVYRVSSPKWFGSKPLALKIIYNVFASKDPYQKNSIDFLLHQKLTQLPNASRFIPQFISSWVQIIVF